MSSLSSLVIPRNRKAQFELEILIQELVNVPLVAGLYYIKWKLKNGKKTNDMTERYVYVLTLFYSFCSPK